MQLSTFKQQVVRSFRRNNRGILNQWLASGDITDRFFCYIQNNRIQMKNYLETIAEEGDLRRVNNQIAHYIRKEFNLHSLKRRNNKPRSLLIQGYTILIP